MSKPIRNLVIMAAAAGLAVLAVLWLTGGLGGGGGEPTAEQLAQGKQVYGGYCADCHGADLEGQPNWRQRGADGLLPAPPHDAKGHTWHHPDAQLFEITKLGTAKLAGPGYKTTMRGFAEELSDDEIRAVLAYIKSRWPEDIRDRQAALNARAKGSN
jgi:mono/diheme cytochrome c family protein